MKDEGMNERLFEQRVREAAAAATGLAAPADAWERIAARVRDGEAVLLLTKAPRRGMTIPATRVAGLVLLACGAAAAAALPASPVRQWLEEVFTANRAADSPPASVRPVDAAPTAPQPEAETTLVLEPVNGGIVVALEAPAQDMSVLVRFVQAGAPEVRATGEAAGAQFRSAAGRLTVANAGGGGLILTIPHTTARVLVEVDGQPYLTKVNGQIRVLAPTADTVGSEILLQIRR